MTEREAIARLARLLISGSYALRDCEIRELAAIEREFETRECPMTSPERIARIEKAVGKLARHVLYIYGGGVGCIGPSLLQDRMKEVEAIAAELSKGEE